MYIILIKKFRIVEIINELNKNERKIVLKYFGGIWREKDWFEGLFKMFDIDDLIGSFIYLFLMKYKVIMY